MGKQNTTTKKSKITMDACKFKFESGTSLMWKSGMGSAAASV